MALRTSMPLSAKCSMPEVGGVIGYGSFRNLSTDGIGRAIAQRNTGTNGENAYSRRVPGLAIRQLPVRVGTGARPATVRTRTATVAQRAAGAACPAALPGRGPAG